MQAIRTRIALIATERRLPKSESAEATGLKHDDLLEWNKQDAGASVPRPLLGGRGGFGAAPTVRIRRATSSGVLFVERRKDLNMMSDDHEVQKILRDALAEMPVTIESGLLDPKASATSKLKWVELALRVFRGPVGRPTTDLDLENKMKVAHTLREAVPTLEKIREEHRSERLRKTAARYLQSIESEVGSSNRD